VVVSGSSEGDRGGVNIGGTMAHWRRRGGGVKGLLTGRGAPFIAAEGAWKIAARVAVKPWAAERRWLTSGARVVLYFSRIIHTGSKVEIENGCLTLLQKLPMFPCG
jgi:hypothetical protein